MRTVGVEEEFLLVDPVDGRARALSAAVLQAASDAGRVVEGELQTEQVEVCTEPCLTLGELAGQLWAARREASDSARQLGAEIAALGTSPVPVAPTMSSGARYRRIADLFGLTSQEQLSCGCHVHTEVESEEEGIAVLDRIRPWLAPLLALSANSPYWQGHDSGYASYRSQVWSRWPTAGPTEIFGAPAVYHDIVRAMVDCGTVLDEGMVYFDARLSARYPTVEIRIADVCLHTEDAVLLAALCRALVETAAREWADGRPADPVRVEMLRLASWRAGRSGLSGELLEPGTHRAAPTRHVLDQLIEHVRDALEDAGEYDQVSRLRDALVRRGDGASLQRAAFARTGQLSDVVHDAIRRTMANPAELRG